MKKIYLLLVVVLAGYSVLAQPLSLPFSGDNQKAKVTQWIGPVEVSITYSSPDVHGPNGEDRKGHIWGELVPYGFSDQGFGSSKAAPWRAGANENTIISFSHDVKVDGKELKAGTYGLFLGVEKSGPWTWIFSKNATSWGSYFYNPAEDALRLKAQPADAPYTEYLTYGFDERLPASSVAYLQWENKRISFKIEAAVNDIYFSDIRNQLRTVPGFDYHNFEYAAQFAVKTKSNLEEALAWADKAMDPGVGGVANFETMQTKATVLRAMNKTAEADAVMDQAIKDPSATVPVVHQYGKSLLAEGKKEKAMEVFQVNFKRHPEEKFTTYVGLARGYAALGDKKNAIKNWETAIKNLPENQKGNKPLYEAEVKKLKEGS